MNNLLELIRRLRSEVPRLDVTAKAARWFGIICLGVVVWNLFIVSTMPMDGFPIRLDSQWITMALVLVAISGVVAFLASKFLEGDPVTGTRVARIALWIWLGGIGMFLVGFWNEMPFQGHGFFEWFFRLMMILVFAQFAVPGWFALGYLNRLEESFAENTVIVPTQEPSPLELESVCYREGLFPWAVQATFLVSMAFVMGAVLLVAKSYGMDKATTVFLPGFLLLFVGPVAWNELASSFQRSRNVVASYRTGISLLFFNATIPFCKVLVYRDGVEIRVQFNRFFLPHDKHREPPALAGLFSTTLVFRTRLPGVPETIRIHTRKASKILEEIERGRAG